MRKRKLASSRSKPGTSVQERGNPKSCDHSSVEGHGKSAWPRARLSLRSGEGDGCCHRKLHVLFACSGSAPRLMPLRRGHKQGKKEALKRLGRWVGAQGHTDPSPQTVAFAKVRANPSGPLAEVHVAETSVSKSYAPCGEPANSSNAADDSFKAAPTARLLHMPSHAEARLAQPRRTLRFLTCQCWRSLPGSGVSGLGLEACWKERSALTALISLRKPRWSLPNNGSVLPFRQILRAANSTESSRKSASGSEWVRSVSGSLVENFSFFFFFRFVSKQRH